MLLECIEIRYLELIGINLPPLKLWNNNKNIIQLPRIYDDEIDAEIKKTKREYKETIRKVNI